MAELTTAGHAPYAEELLAAYQIFQRMDELTPVERKAARTYSRISMTLKRRQP